MPPYSLPLQSRLICPLYCDLDLLLAEPLTLLLLHMPLVLPLQLLLQSVGIQRGSKGSLGFLFMHGKQVQMTSTDLELW